MFSPEQTRALTATVKHGMLYLWDPIGIKEYPQCSDEYDNYVHDILKLLVNDCGFSELYEKLSWIETTCMGLPGNRENTVKFAKHLVDERQRLNAWK